MNFFSYDSKPMQVLMYIGDLIILNLLFLLCCLPVFTIGAAHAALYSGIRTLQDPEDDTAPSKAFFKGFRTGFKQITIAWNILFIATLALALIAYLCMGFDALSVNAPTWMSFISLAVAAVFMSLVTLFHSRFTCSAWQLVRNCWFLAVAHPLRTIVVTALTWLPVVVIFLPNATGHISTLIGLTPIWFLLYYSTAALFSFAIMKKPFKTLIDHFNETQNPPAAEESAEEESQAETE